MITLSIISERIINNDVINWHALKKKIQREKEKVYWGRSILSGRWRGSMNRVAVDDQCQCQCQSDRAVASPLLFHVNCDGLKSWIFQYIHGSLKRLGPTGLVRWACGYNFLISPLCPLFFKIPRDCDHTLLINQWVTRSPISVLCLCSWFDTCHFIMVPRGYSSQTLSVSTGFHRDRVALMLSTSPFFFFSFWVHTYFFTRYFFTCQLRSHSIVVTVKYLMCQQCTLFTTLTISVKWIMVRTKIECVN